MTELFLRLTPDWVLRAVEAGGFLPTGHALQLNSLTNRVYDLKLYDETHVVVKFYRPGRWSRQAILEEHRFLFDLKEAEIPAVAPLVFENGETLHEVEGILYAVWPRVGGRAPDELTDEQIEILGRLLARIHNVGASGTSSHRPILDADNFGLASLESLIRGSHLPPTWAARYERAARSVIQIYREWSRGVSCFRVHGDCHFSNLLAGREGFFFLDFDDHLVGPAVQDVFMLMPARDAEGLRQRELFLEGYQEFRPFERRSLRLIEPLRALRYIRYAAWIASSWRDPAFPLAFPQFGGEPYWQGQTMDLEEQLRVIAESGEPLPADFSAVGSPSRPESPEREW